MSTTEKRTAMLGDLLSALQPGKENALLRGSLAAKMQIGDRQVRLMIEELRDQGVLICNDQDGRGYYLASTTEEIERQYRRDLARAKSVYRRLKTSRMLLQAAGRATE